MKKQALLLSALGMLAFGSCQTEVEDHDDAYIDSVVNARVEEMRIELMMQNDSLIYALAQQKADSMLAAMKGGNQVTTKTTTTRTTTVKDKGTTTTTEEPTTTPNVPTNTGKNTGEAGENTGKRGNQSEGTNTGKRR